MTKHWYSMLVDPIEDSLCLIRTTGLIAFFPWLVAAGRAAAATHPHLLPIAESGAAYLTSFGGSLSAKRWAQGRAVRFVPGTAVEGGG